MANAGDMLDALGVDAVCEMIVDGASYAHIASSAGVSKSAFIAWVARDADRSARVREARILSAQTFDELAELSISQASDVFELSRAKELAHHYRWRAAKRSPEYRENKGVEVTGAGGGPVQVMTLEFVDAKTTGEGGTD